MWVARFGIPLAVAAAAPRARPFTQDVFALLQSKLRDQDQLDVSDKFLQDARLGVKAFITHFSNTSIDEQVGLVSEELADADRKEAWVHSIEALLGMVPNEVQDVGKALDGAQEAFDGPVMKSFLNGAFEEYFGDSMTEIRDAVDRTKSLAQRPSIRSAVAQELKDAVNGMKDLDVRGMIERLADEKVLRHAVTSARDLFPEPLPREVQPITLAQIRDSEDGLNPRDPKPKPPRTEWRGYMPNSDPDSFRYVAQPMPPSTQVLFYTILGFVVGTQQGVSALSAFYEYLRHNEKYRAICTFVVMMHQIVDTIIAHYSSKFFVMGGEPKLHPGEALIGDDYNSNETLYQGFTNKKKRIVNTSTRAFYDEFEQAATAVGKVRAAMQFWNETAHIPDALKMKAVNFLPLLDKLEEDMYYANPDFTIESIQDPDVKAAFRKRYNELKDVVGSTITLANHPAAPLPGWPEHTHNASKLMIQANMAVLHLRENMDYVSKQLMDYCNDLAPNFEMALFNAAKHAEHHIELKLRPGADWARAHPVEASVEREKELKKMGIKRPDVPAIGLDEDKNLTEGLSFSRTRGLKPKGKQELTEEAKEKMGGMERANMELIKPFEEKVRWVLKVLESLADERGLKTTTPTENPDINVFPVAKYEHFYSKTWMARFIGMWGLYNGYNGGLQWMAHDPGAKNYLAFAHEHPDIMPYYADAGYYHVDKIENPFHRYFFQALRPMIQNGVIGAIIGSFFGADDVSKGNVGLANS